MSQPMPLSYTAAELVAVAGLLISLVLVIRAWPVLPKQIPVHFGFSGKPDGWGPKGLIAIVPATALFLWMGLTLLGKLPVSGRSDLWLLVFSKIEVVWLFTYITWKMIQVGLGKAEGLGKRFLPVAVIPFACVMIAYVVLVAPHSH